MYCPFFRYWCFSTVIHYYQSLPHLTYFRTGTGENQRNIDIWSCYEAIGVNHTQAILGFHILRGCDQIGRFSGKPKLLWWKSFLKADNNILNALSWLGTDENLSDRVTLSTLERFVVNTYDMCDTLFKPIYRVFIFFTLMKFRKT